MVDYLLRSALRPDQPRPSIETLLHAFVPAPHVDHTHPDAVIALTSTPDGRRLAEEAFGDEAVWLDYQRPGFDMSRRIAQLLEEQPAARAVLLEKHGLVTWGATGHESYEATIEFVATRRARDRGGGEGPLRAGRPEGRGARRGERRSPPVEVPSRAPRRAPRRRRRARARGRPEPRGGRRSPRRCARPRSARSARPCPDHLINTKHKPLFLEFDPETGGAVGSRRGVPARRRGVRRLVPRLLRAQPRRRDAAVPDRPGRAPGRARAGRRDRHDGLRCRRAPASRATCTTGRSPSRTRRTRSAASAR